MSVSFVPIIGKRLGNLTGLSRCVEYKPSDELVLPHNYHLVNKKTGLELRLQTGSIVHFSTSNAALLPVFATHRGRSGSLL
jgi:hypothetical protein